MDEYSKKQDNDADESFNSKDDESTDLISDIESKKTEDGNEEKSFAHQIERPHEKEEVKEAFIENIKNNGATPTAPPASGGLIILQWLTYVFWGWTLLALVWLMFIVFGSTIQDMDVSGVIPYAIASTLVLLPISFICDWFYGKREPQKKTGGAMVVMVIHAVIFALFAIGSLISGVLILVQMMIATPTDASTQMVWLATSMVSALLYAVTFARTLNPLPQLKLNRIYPIGMAVFVIVLIVLGFIGPVAKAAMTKDDRDIEKYLPKISYTINNYVDSKGELPDNLANLELDDAEKTLINRGLVTYKKDDSSSISKIDQYSGSRDEEYQHTYHRYQLCVDYKAQKKGDSFSGSLRQESEYSSSLYISGHSAGQVCYKVEASSTSLYSDSFEDKTSLFDQV